MPTKAPKLTKSGKPDKRYGPKPGQGGRGKKKKKVEAEPAPAPTVFEDPQQGPVEHLDEKGVEDLRAKAKPKEEKQDLLVILEEMVEKVVRKALGPDVIKAKPLAVTPKLQPGGTEATRAQARLMFDNPRDILDIPNPDPARCYYWVKMHAHAQQKMIQNGYTFVVGPDAIRELGYDPAIMMNGRGRCFYMDVELAWCERELADIRRSHMSKKTRAKIDQTTEAFESAAGKFGELIRDHKVTKETIRGQGSMFDVVEGAE